MQDLVGHAAVETARNSGRPQIVNLINHLTKSKGATISQYEALMLYRIAALPRRISDLESMGVKIDRRWKRDETGHNYMVYSLAGEEAGA